MLTQFSWQLFQVLVLQIKEIDKIYTSRAVPNETARWYGGR